MKTRIYLRIAKGKRRTIVKADTKPNYESISTNGYNRQYFPTVQFTLDIDIPDKEFDASRILLNTKIKETKPAVEIKQVIEEKKDLEKKE